MRSRTLFIIIAIVILLGGLWGYLQYRGGTPITQPVAFDLSSVSSDTVNSLRIAQGADAVSLAVVDSVWQIDSKKVSQSMIDTMWSTLKNLKITGPVSTSPANHDRFEVSEANAMKVTFTKDSSVAQELYIGKSAETYSSSYLRVGGNDEVFIADYNLRSLFPTLTDAWYEKGTSTQENL